MSAIVVGSSADIAIDIDDSSTESRILERTAVVQRKRKSPTARAVSHTDKRPHLASIPPSESGIPHYIGAPVVSSNINTVGSVKVVVPQEQHLADNHASNDEGRLMHALMMDQVQVQHSNGPDENEINISSSDRVRISVSPYVKLDRATSADEAFHPSSIHDDATQRTFDAVEGVSTNEAAAETAAAVVTAVSHEHQEQIMDIVANVASQDPTQFDAISYQAPFTYHSSGTDENFPSVDRAVRYLQLLIPVCLVFVTFALAFPVHSIHTAGNKDYGSNDPTFPTIVNWYGVGSTSLKPQISKVSMATVKGSPTERKKPLTLREIVNDRSIGFHLAMAPAFFGFYGYFGALAAWMDSVANVTEMSEASGKLPLKSVAGASAGAMAAVLLAAGISPVDAAAFCGNITLDKFADFPGFGAVFRGNKFERLMSEFLSNCTLDNRHILTMEDAILPVAVTAFDLQTMSGKIVTTGSMARAARASATFPGLFQPVAWNDSTDDCIFIDGGIFDPFGMMGLTKTMSTGKQQEGVDGVPVRDRVINLRVGSFRKATPPGPLTLPGSPDVISIAIEGLPLPGPWAMENGPLAFEAARIAMISVMDSPLELLVARPGVKAVQGDGLHYLLVVKAK